MNESDLQLARAIVADDKFNTDNYTPNGSPTAFRKTVNARAADKFKFR